MNVAVVSDTHMPRFGRVLPPALVAGLEDHGVELVLHLGDFTQPLVADLFAERWLFEAVAGNNDPPEIHQRYGRRRVLELGGVRVGLIHGDGPTGTTRSRATAAFAGEAVEAVLFGHSHIPYLARLDDRWLLNPGSPTDKRRQPRYSFAILSISDGVVTPELHFYDDRR